MPDRSARDPDATPGALTLPVLSAVALVLPAEGMDPAGIVSLAAPFALWWMINRDSLDWEAVASAGAIPGSF